MHDLTASITDGALDALTNEERAARLEAITTRYLRVVAGAIADAIGTDVAPAVDSMVGTAVERALSVDAQRGVERIAAAAARAAVQSMTHTMTESIARDIGPAMRRTIEDDLGPALDTMVRENLGPSIAAVVAHEITPAVGVASREASREAVLGTSDALTQLRRAGASEPSRGGGPGTMLASVQRMASSGLRIARIAVAATTALALAIGVWIGWLLLRLRRYRDESARHAASAAILTEAIRSADEASWSPQLRARLREYLRNQRGADDARQIEHHRGIRRRKRRWLVGNEV